MKLVRFHFGGEGCKEENSSLKRFFKQFAMEFNSVNSTILE